jgi:hypothetical protein
MKKVILAAILWSGALLAPAADAPTDLTLLDGSRIKGRIMSSTASEVTVLSDFGVLRIALDKLSAESKASLAQASKPDVDALLKRISELEGRVAQLQQENDTLKRNPSQVPVAPAFRPSATQSLTPGENTTTRPAGASYTVSSTGKRHNSSCRYFGTGRSAGANEGVACKICGG